MDRIRDMSTFFKYLHKIKRWGAKKPEILQIRGAELVRERPAPPPPQPVKSEEKA